jgi:hypothetical protein
MTKRNRDINIFSVSFLDLLSGALAAVIILFVIVPKMDLESQETLDALEGLEIQLDDLLTVIEQMDNSIDRNAVEELQRRVQEMQNSLIEARIAAQQAQIINESLREELAQNEQNLRMANAQIAELNSQISELQESRNQESNQGPAHKALLGLSPDFAILASWSENVDLDIHFTNLATGEVCYHRNVNTPFGKLLEDVTSSPGEEGYEMIYQQKLVPGRYRIEIHWYDYNNPQSNYSAVNAEIEILFMPFRSNEQKNIKNVRLTNSNRTLITTLTINQDGFL